MLRYSVKRLLQSVVTIFIVISLVFLLLRLMPIRGYFPQGSWAKTSPEVRISVLQGLGIYDANGQEISPFVQLYHFFVKLFTEFSFGESTQLYVGKQIGDIIGPKIALSLSMGLISTFISLLLGFMLGIAMARKKGGIVDFFGTIYITLVRGIPELVYFFVILYFGTLWMHIPMIFYTDQWMTWILPIFCLSIGSIAGTAVWMRRYMVDELNKDYVKLAYAKGLPDRKVMSVHVLRNAFVPMSYAIPVSILLALSGSIYVEMLFSIPGMGRLLIAAISSRDNNLVQSLTFIYATLGIFGVFLGDLFMVLVDPRISLETKGGSRS